MLSHQTQVIVDSSFCSFIQSFCDRLSWCHVVHPFAQFSLFLIHFPPFTLRESPVINRSQVRFPCFPSFFLPLLFASLLCFFFPRISVVSALSLGSLTNRVQVRRGHVVEDAFSAFRALGSRVRHRIQIEFMDKEGNPEAGIDGGR